MKIRLNYSCFTAYVILQGYGRPGDTWILEPRAISYCEQSNVLNELWPLVMGRNAGLAGPLQRTGTKMDKSAQRLARLGAKAPSELTGHALIMAATCMSECLVAVGLALDRRSELWH